MLQTACNALQVLWNVIDGVVLNVSGGILTVIVVDRFRRFLSWRHRRGFREFFGEDILSGTDFHLVSTSFELDPARIRIEIDPDTGKPYRHIYRKHCGGGSPGAHISINEPGSSSEVRATKYFAEVIGDIMGQTPSLSIDYELRDQLNISFVSFGSHNSNSKTEDTLKNRGNEFVEFPYEGFLIDVNRWFVDKNGKRIPGDIEPGFDYGLIMKVRPTQYPERTWFICAGFGEWGTSGAAHYVAHRWKEIHEHVKAEPFAIIVKVAYPSRQDESAEPIAHCYGHGPWVRD